VEVKPGKPFTHKYEDSKGRLHISMVVVVWCCCELIAQKPTDFIVKMCYF